MPILNVNETTIYYQSTGKGIPILFIHPPVLNSKNFTYQVKDLSSFFQVITFDIRGHGKSSRSEQSLTYSLIASDMKMILNELGIEKAFLCGYSMGASIALEFMLSYPDRTWGGILLSGLSEVNDWKVRNQMSLGAALASAGGVSSLAFSISWTNADGFPMFYKLFHEAKKGSSKEIKEYYQSGMNYNCTERLSSLMAPILLLNGAKDKHYHPYAKRMMDYLPNREWKLIEHVRHHLPTKTSIEVNDLIKQFIFTHKNKGEESESAAFFPFESQAETSEQLIPL